jgi:bifunctional NMN adenylyltransferase/nudix hydrolase
MVKKSDFIVFILRAQPPTNAHQKIIEDALKEAYKVILVLGSYRTPKTIKNPWSYEERKELILNIISEEDRKRLIFIPLRDYLYNDVSWISSLQNQVANIVGESKSVKLIGHFKDDSSYYLKYFPQWQLIEESAVKVNGKTINATDVRNYLFSGSYEMCPSFIHQNTFKFLAQYTSTKEYQNLKEEYKYIQDYKKQWENSPYPPIFVTVDCVVIQSGHILLIKRKVNPGKGMFALPGGFINANERIEDSALRELKEETKIAVDNIILRKAIKDVHIFDHPVRSLRGRTITHAYFIQLDNTKPLPKVNGGDDADKAMWIPFNDVILNEEQFFEDHLGIIQYFISIGGGN